MTALAVIGAVVVVLVVVGGIVGFVASSSKTGTTSAPSSTTTVPGGRASNGGGAASGPVGQASANPAPVGTSVTPAKDWTVRVTAAQLDGDATMKTENAFVSPNTGKQFVIVSVSVTNGSAQAAATAANVKFHLLAPSGVATDVSWARPPNQYDIASQLQPGATLTGALAFEVPSADVGGSVLLVEPVFTMTPQQDQRFLALS